jgi:hypothetical protein
MNVHVFPTIWGLKKNSVLMAFSIVAMFFVLAAAPSIGGTMVNAQKGGNPPDHYVVQRTAASGPDPLPGHQGHQLVMAIPPRDDGKIWTGTISYVASYPVEMVILHMYDNKSVSGNESSVGKPLTAPFGKGQVAITLVKEPSNTPVPSGSLNFAGNAVAFHTLDGHKFIVTYTADARAEDVSKISK